ncbi:GAF domain-containing sensor histidine kinase [Herbidospora mongoliensis]|uniref:GAF domain-containing sensor histidine kinase n=1 Tax=Herbidospora mongoliensis TaxID=688067 RepID=UPI00083674CD|nr:ATP-binding protein [Herbidospora mongoliensis]
MTDADVAVLRFGNGTEIADGDVTALVDDESAQSASIPLGREGSVRAVLEIGKRPGRLPFTPSLLRMLSAFADQASIALELAEAREDAERLGLLEDRHRIAKDLRAHIVELVEGARGHLGFMPGLRMEGWLDNAVGDAVAEQLLAVLREALSNLVRHAKATRAEVVAEVTGGKLTLIVQDDGVGVPPEGRRSGLRNLEERATLLGGSFTIGAADGWNTRLRWSVPVH